MKAFGLILLCILNFTVFAQPENQHQSIQQIEIIFRNYIEQKENIDSKKNEMDMKAALTSLQTGCDSKHYHKLIDVWMYYDPTDFQTRQLIEPILLLNKDQALMAIERRIKKKKKWETLDTAPYSDLLHLKEEFKKTN